jgi:hypothetical protein
MSIFSHLGPCDCTQSPKYLEMAQGHISLSEGPPEVRWAPATRRPWGDRASEVQQGPVAELRSGGGSPEGWGCPATHR